MIKKLLSSVILKMDQLSTPLIKLSLFIIFFWFGALKPLGISAAENLVLDTVYWMPFLSPWQWLNVIGYWEMIKVSLFFFNKTIKYVYLTFFADGCTFKASFYLAKYNLPGRDDILTLPTLEGQYIIKKNIIIISAAMVIGSLSESITSQYKCSDGGICLSSKWAKGIRTYEHK